MGIIVCSFNIAVKYGTEQAKKAALTHVHFCSWDRKGNSDTCTGTNVSKRLPEENRKKKNRHENCRFSSAFQKAPKQTAKARGKHWSVPVFGQSCWKGNESEWSPYSRVNSMNTSRLVDARSVQVTAPVCQHVFIRADLWHLLPDVKNLLLRSWQGQKIACPRAGRSTISAITIVHCVSVCVGVCAKTTTGRRFSAVRKFRTTPMQHWAVFSAQSWLLNNFSFAINFGTPMLDWDQRLSWMNQCPKSYICWVDLIEFCELHKTLGCCCKLHLRSEQMASAKARFQNKMLVVLFPHESVSSREAAPFAILSSVVFGSSQNVELTPTEIFSSLDQYCEVLSCLSCFREGTFPYWVILWSHFLQIRN